MRPRHVALMLALTIGAWLLPSAAHAGLKVTTINVKGMVCQA